MFHDLANSKRLPAVYLPLHVAAAQAQGPRIAVRAATPWNSARFMCCCNA